MTHMIRSVKKNMGKGVVLKEKVYSKHKVTKQYQDM